MAFDPTKPVATRDGRKARILSTDRISANGFSIVTLITEKDGREAAFYHHPDGTIGAIMNSNDLVNVGTKKWRWSYIEKDSPYLKVTVAHYISREEAVKSVRTLGPNITVLKPIRETEIEE